ncbi:aspartate carbamoyltransferase regulatory subunit [Youngiibacter multivorans]|uniref:Aspartate carbamoyltransferase regulatory subunit n=1 Tax=Youngiibacter multivorans TaxID=937251 RepID=A0ABS4G3U4_9CLOT|nr:aspartate carbamoyltransferase regulatory subunit [Youngiibacter multivorans]MBP1919212.1 aspartate carbamoyltransferase regulatory subunit [Youngiibacter multivorans]
MLEVKGIDNGIVIDHISAGNGIRVFNRILAEDIETPVVLLINVESKKLGKKDIIKLADVFDINLDILGLIDQNITVNVVKDSKIVEKYTAVIPDEVTGLFSCDNPRCISNSDSYAVPKFKFFEKNGAAKYICSYCEEITKFRL